MLQILLLIYKYYILCICKENIVFVTCNVAIVQLKMLHFMLQILLLIYKYYILYICKENIVFVTWNVAIVQLKMLHFMLQNLLSLRNTTFYVSVSKT